MIFKYLCICVLRMKVASALEGLTPGGPVDTYCRPLYIASPTHLKGIGVKREKMRIFDKQSDEQNIS